MANINDTVSVQALLEQLRSSPAWQQTMGTFPAVSESTPAEVASTVSAAATTPALHSVTGDVAQPATHPREENLLAQPSVASLLSQLQSSPAIHALASEPAPHVAQDSAAGRPATSKTMAQPDVASLAVDPRTARLAAPPAVPKQDLRNFTFQQTLSVIAQLSEDKRFVEAIQTLKEEQIHLERRLWDERQAIEKKHAERVQVARTKATLIGVALSKFEADNMTAGFRRDLQQFDAERVLPAWDGLVLRQQTTLERLGVPAMYPTQVQAELQKQQKVIQVLVDATE